MKRPALYIGVAIALASLTATAFAAPKSGTKCAKQGQVQIYKGKKFTCIKKGRVLVWDKGILIPTNPKPLPSPSNSNSQSETTNTNKSTDSSSASNKEPQTTATSSCPLGSMNNNLVKTISATASEVKFSTLSPINLEIEDAYRIEIEARNQGSGVKEVFLKNVTFGWQSTPKDPSQKWYIQFFQISSSHATLKPGESKVFAWHLDPVDSQPEGQIEPNIRFDFEVGSEKTNVIVDFVIYQMNPKSLSQYGLTADSEVKGTLRDSTGKPISDVDVDLWLFNMKIRYEFVRTDFNGRFTICIPSREMLIAKLGNRTSPYPLVTYLVAETTQGYVYTSVLGERGKSQTIEITAKPSTKKELTVVNSLQVPTANGWWRARKFDGGFAVVDGRHPPELGVKGTVAILETNGTLRKQLETGNECWGLDVSNTGTIAAGCHDGSLYVWDSRGTLLWKKDQTGARINVLNRWVKFSPDGSKLITGPFEDVAELYDVQSGRKLWGHSPKPNDGRKLPQLLRQAVFTKDGKYAYISLEDGWISKLQTSDGKELWGNWFLGEFAMSLEVDNEENIYAVGKSREVISIAPSGEIRWRTLAYEASGMSIESAILDNYFIVNCARSVYAVDMSNGKIAWWHPLNSLYSQSAHVGSGHNALDVDTSRGLILHGAGTPGGGSLVSVLTKEGAVVATKQFEDAREKTGEVLNINHIGAASVLFTKDGKILAVFGDGFIRLLSLN